MLWGSWIHLCTVISLLQKQSAGSNLKGWLCIHAYLRGKYLNKLEKYILGSLILLNLQHYNHSSLSYNHSQVIYIVYHRRQSLCFLFLDNLSAPREEIAKYYYIASSFHNIFHLMHDKIHNEVNTCTS